MADVTRCDRCGKLRPTKTYMSVVDRWSTVQRHVLLGGRFDLCPACTDRALAKPVTPSSAHRPAVTIGDRFYGERTYLVGCHGDEAAFGSWEDAMLFANAHAGAKGAEEL